jgi:PAS domain S-box-containing protein
MPSESELRNEIADLRRQVGQFERAEAEWRRTEAALRESEQRLSTLLSNLPGMAYRCRNDNEWTMQFVSEGCKLLTGYDSADVVDSRGITWNQLVHPEDRQRVHEEVQQAIDETRAFEIIYRVLAASGEKKWVWERGVGLVDDDGQVRFVEGFITDISERVQVENELTRRVGDRTGELAETNRQLQESLDELRAISDAVVDGLIVVDATTGECVRANPQMAHMLGYTLEDLPKDPAAVHRPEHMAELAEKFRDQVEGHLPLAEDVPFLHKDGRDIYADISGSPMVYQDRPCLVNLVRDVTERHHAGEALQQSEAKYRSLVEGSPDAMVMSELSGKILLASRRTWGMLQISENVELAGRSVFDFVVDRQQLEANIRDLVEKGIRRHSEYTLLRPDKTTVPVEVSSSIVCGSENQPVALMAVIRDITERKRVEEARRQSEERFRAIFEEAPVGMVIGNPDRTIARVNKAMGRISGHTADEMIGKHVETFMHPDDRDVSAPHVEKLVRGEISSFTVERRYLAKGGRPFWAQATTATIQSVDGSLAFGLGIVEDIDDRKRAQAALERERKTLWHMLRSSDHERQLIAYDIHDGLAQQLAAAAMQFQTYDHLKIHDPESAKTAFDAGIQMVQQAHSEARRLISGVRPPILDESGIVAALAHLAHDQQAFDGPSIEFQSDVEFRRLEPVLENAVYRIAQEALANSCQHSGSSRVRLALIQVEETIRIEVQDWGVGFDSDEVDENRFGLRGIRERARLLGGEAIICSQPGEGTSVEVKLPLVLAQEHGGGTIG